MKKIVLLLIILIGMLLSQGCMGLAVAPHSLGNGQLSTDHSSEDIGDFLGTALIVVCAVIGFAAGYGAL